MLTGVVVCPALIFGAPPDDVIIASAVDIVMNSARTRAWPQPFRGPVSEPLMELPSVDLCQSRGRPLADVDHDPVAQAQNPTEP